MDQHSSESEAECSAREREERAFGEELGDDTKASGTECGADSNFTAAADGPDEEEIGDVGAGDQKYQADDPEQDEQRLTHRASEQFAEWNELDRVAGGFSMLLADAVHDAGNIGLCLGERNSRLETANDVEVMVFAISAEFAFPIGGGAEDFGNDIDGVDPELDVAAIAETGGKDSDDLHGLIVEGDGFADDGGVAAEVALPETVGDDCDARGAEGSLEREKGAAENWLDSEKGENGSRRDHRRDAFGGAYAGEVEAQAVNGSQLGKGAVLGLEIEEVGAREGRFGEMGLRLPEPNEFPGRRIGEGTHEDGVDYAEDCGVGADT